MELSSLPPIVLKLIKFVAVGASGLVIDFGLTYFFREKLKANEYVANAIGFFAAATNNFLINRYWTFANHDPEIWIQYFKFISFALIGLGINSAIIWYLHSRGGRNFYVSKAIATVVVTLWNFLSNFFFTFK